MSNGIPLYYWYQSGGWVMAIDAISQPDARQLAVRLAGRDVQYIGLLNASAFPPTACGCITDRRQAQIESNNRRTP